MADVVLRKLQVAYESTPGTPGTASRIIPMSSISVKEKQDYHEPMPQTGTYGKNLVVAPQGKLVDWSFDTFLYLNDLPYFLQSLMYAYTATVYDTNGFEHKYKDFQAAPLTRRVLTLEFFDSSQGFKISYAVVKAIQITGTEAGEVKVTVSGFGQGRATGSMTGSLTLPVVAPIQTWARTFYIDNAGTALSTAVNGRLVEFSYEMDNGAQPIWAGNNTQNFYTVTYGHFAPKLTIKALYDHSGFAEFSNYVAGTARVVGLKLVGPTLTAANQDVQIVSCGNWNPFDHSEFKTASAVELGVIYQYDATLTYSNQITVHNAVNSTAYT